jgi:hypothetical protein
MSSTLLSNRQRQEFVQNDPLIVPADLALGQFEDLVIRLIGKSGYNSGEPCGPLPYTLSRSNAAVRKFVVFFRVAWFEQGGLWVKRDIVVQELTEEGHAGRHVGIVGIIRTEYAGFRDRLYGVGEVIQGVDKAAFFAQLLGLCTYGISRRGEGRQVRKHARKGIVGSGRPFPQAGKV